MRGLPRHRAVRQWALRYQNRDVVESFAKRFRVPDAEARRIFGDTKRWLWLNTVPGCSVLAVTSELMIIDEMWHTFVLYTNAYTEYCDRVLGRYIHHLPTSPRDRRREERLYRRDPEGHLRRNRERTEAQYNFIAEHLGTATLKRWYAEYPLRYGRAFFARFGIEVEEMSPAVKGRLRAVAG